MKTGENGIISVNLYKIYVIFLLVKDPELEKSITGGGGGGGGTYYYTNLPEYTIWPLYLF